MRLGLTRAEYEAKACEECYSRSLSKLSGSAFAALSMLMVVTGCKTVGPGSIPRDRFDYSTSMTESWKRQTLLNIVRLRYLDPPSFVDVGQIVAGYSLETGLEASAQLAKTGAGDTFAGVGGHMVFTDRPTITYTPLTGSRFVRGLMNPIPPESVFFAIQSGWPADAMLSLAVVALNGLRNEEASLEGHRTAEPRFTRAASLLRRIQLSGGVALKIVQDKEKRETKLLTFRAKRLSPETLQDIAELRALLDLDPNTTEFPLVFGTLPASNREIAVQTRSLLHILSMMAARAEVPAEHLREGRAVRCSAEPASFGEVARARPLVRCSKDKPKDAFVSVEYRRHWFWVDDQDLAAKRTFSFMLLLFTLSDTNEKESLPLITIPAQ